MGIMIAVIDNLIDNSSLAVPWIFFFLKRVLYFFRIDGIIENL